MVRTRWENIRGKEVRYSNSTWTLTGDVDVRDRGKVLAVDAEQAHDVRGKSATLYFGTDSGAESLNPGDLGEHFDRLEQDDDTHYLVVKKPSRTYRYELLRLNQG